MKIKLTLFRLTKYVSYFFILVNFPINFLDIIFDIFIHYKQRYN